MQSCQITLEHLPVKTTGYRLVPDGCLSLCSHKRTPAMLDVIESFLDNHQIGIRQFKILQIAPGKPGSVKRQKIDGVPHQGRGQGGQMHHHCRQWSQRKEEKVRHCQGPHPDPSHQDHSGTSPGNWLEFICLSTMVEDKWGDCCEFGRLICPYIIHPWGQLEPHSTYL